MGPVGVRPGSDLSPVRVRSGSDTGPTPDKIDRKVKILLNGDPYEIAEPVTVSGLLARLEIDARRVAVEHNLTVIKRGAFEDTLVKDGDEIEIVNFVGGG